METVRVHVYMEGRVQGVFYRDWTRNSAKELGLTGWVKNLEDGRVEAIFEGEKGKVKKMLEYCKKGSKLASVEHMDIIWEKATRRRQGYDGQAGEFEGFAIIR